MFFSISFWLLLIQSWIFNITEIYFKKLFKDKTEFVAEISVVKAEMYQAP